MANTRANTIRTKSHTHSVSTTWQHWLCSQTNAKLTTPLFYLLTVKHSGREAGIAISGLKTEHSITVVSCTQINFHSQYDVTKLAVMTYAALRGLLYPAVYSLYFLYTGCFWLLKRAWKGKHAYIFIACAYHILSACESCNKLTQLSFMRIQYQCMHESCNA